MEIPIQNIYYLLCYAWNQLEEKDKINVQASDYNSYINLFAKVLVNGCGYIFKRGLDRDYINYQETINGIRGKLDIANTLKKNLQLQAKTVCMFDELDYNVLHNQIIRTTVGKILKCKELDHELKRPILEIYRRFQKVEEVYLNSQVYQRVRLHKNNQFYRFILNVTKIINENIVLDEKTGDYQFMDFVRDERKMAYVFENFVRNFYYREQGYYDVKPELINWIAVSDDPAAMEYLPKMKTDISLNSATRKIIIDTKYYKEALQQHYNKESIISGNMYQIFSYLKNVEIQGGPAKDCEGILLYPTVTREMDLNYKMENHSISIKTINLYQDWQQIRSDLLSIID